MCIHSGQLNTENRITILLPIKSEVKARITGNGNSKKSALNKISGPLSIISKFHPMQNVQGMICALGMIFFIFLLLLLLNKARCRVLVRCFCLLFCTAILDSLIKILLAQINKDCTYF